MIGLVDKYINSLIVSISPILEVRGKISYAKFQHKRHKIFYIWDAKYIG